MLFSDILAVLQWWIVIFGIGVIFLPLTTKIFFIFFDKGYIFSKIIGMALISYAVFILGFLKILPFTEITVISISFVFLLINIFLISKYPNILISLKKTWKIFFFEEFIFLAVLFFWSYIHAHQPDIHGLEKYMDFGFINSILRSNYFPPKDMWLTPFPINYYYFGHLVTAVLTKLSNISSSITFNLMLSTISALSFVSAFSIGANLTRSIILSKQSASKDLDIKKLFILSSGLLTAFILNFAGNLHSIYLFFKPYANENPVPFWNLVFSPFTFSNSYWYPNATRFIYNTIHEFPIYSSVVSDLHGHVLDIPFVLLTIAVLLSFLYQHVILKPERLKNLDSSLRQVRLGFVQNDIMMIALISFLLAVMYMTNAWDGIIYSILAVFIIIYIVLKSIINPSEIKNSKLKIQNYITKFKTVIPTLAINILILGAGFIIFTMPFNLNFKPFASGIGVICAPDFLTKVGKIGPFLFEENHCQRSPLWQLGILYGFFYFWVISFIIFLFRLVILSRTKLGEGSRKILRFAQNDISISDIFIFILIILSTLLIILPELIYVKDIYPAHYRANTMFKLVYQAFIMLSISSGYIIIRIITNFKFQISNFKLVYWAIGLFVLLVVFLYSYFAINSYFGDLKNYSGLDGTRYLKSLYSNDYEAISWINKNIKSQPVILEAQGDSYTDYARVSVNTGLPTVLGWTVHEWLWRGTYDIPSPRIAEVQKLYELDIYDQSEKYYTVQPGDYLIKIAAEIKFGDWRSLFDLNRETIENPSLIYPNQKLKLNPNRENQIINSRFKEFKDLINKHKISLVFIGELEKQKYPNLKEDKFKLLGKIIYQKNNTKIYKTNNN